MRLIETARPNVAFLDLQMPELDGIGVVRLVKKKHLPLVVFVTAYEEYALRAFERGGLPAEAGERRAARSGPRPHTSATRRRPRSSASRSAGGWR